MCIGFIDWGRFLLCFNLISPLLHGYSATEFWHLCLAGCSVSGPAMEVFGQPAVANLTVTSSPVAVVTGQPFMATPHLPSNLHSVAVPHTDARWVISVTVQ